jgi:hypothetical protein
VRVFRRSASLADVAVDARPDHAFPAAFAPLAARHDVVQERGRDYMTDKEIREAVRWLDSLDQQ